MYQPLFTKHFEKQLKKLPQKEQRNILEKISQCLNNPRAQSIKLETTYPSIYRLRIGEYRVFFSLNNETKIIEITDVIRRTSQTYNEPLVRHFFLFTILI